MKFLGQHFLNNHAISKKIVAAIGTKNGETIIEIGPGHGELTLLLAEAAAKTEAKLIAIEKDKNLFSELENLNLANFTVISGDVLEVLPKLSLELDGPKTADYKLIGNIPYYLTAHLLRIIGELEHKPIKCIFMVQKEVAERIAAKPPKMNRLAASVQYWSEPKITLSVPRTNFSPPPNVDSAVIQLTTKEGISKPDSYYAAVHTLFAQPRKTILNNLTSKQSPFATKEGTSKESVSKKLFTIELNPSLRPQNLRIEDIERIAEIGF